MDGERVQTRCFVLFLALVFCTKCSTMRGSSKLCMCVHVCVCVRGNVNYANALMECVCVRVCAFDDVWNVTLG